jgi:hypothetical protein
LAAGRFWFLLIEHHNIFLEKLMEEFTPQPNSNTLPHESLAVTPVAIESQPPIMLDASDSPFRTMLDPEMRANMREALIKLIDCHDEELARYVSQGKLSLDSYKEYVELFARSLRECMESRDGIAYLLKACGFDIAPTDINLKPEWRWRN